MLTLNERQKKWLFRYKLIDIVIWTADTVYVVVANYDSRLGLLPQIGGGIVSFFLVASTFYMVRDFIFPKYFVRRNIWYFLMALSLWYVINLFISVTAGIGYRNSFYNASLQYNFLTYKKLVVVYFFNNLIVTIIAVAAGLWEEYRRKLKSIQLAEKEKLSDELRYLRSHINPDFLIRSVKVIESKLGADEMDAGEFLLQLEKLLHYQLYECTNNFIEIERELAYIHNYIEIQRQRIEQGSDINVNINTGLQGFKIAPLLILPLVENAFKHVSHYKNERENSIHVIIEEEYKGRLKIKITNTYDIKVATKHLVNFGGIGIQNLKRRLTLLYPGRHELAINKGKEMFEAILTIDYGQN